MPVADRERHAPFLLRLPDEHPASRKPTKHLLDLE